MDTVMSPPSEPLPTPPASSATPSHHPSPLPQPRRQPLKPGGVKESALIRYLDNAVNNVQKNVDNRVHKQKVEDGGIGGTGEGYRAFWEAAKDLDGIIDVVWVSGSPNLQIPYLLNIAALISEYLTLFKPAPRSTFRLLDKLDSAFSSLLQGRDADSGDPLPGFEGGRPVSITDKVRLKGILERTRLVVVRVMSGEHEGHEDEPEETDGDTTMGEETDGEGKGKDEVFVKFEGFENTEDEDDEDDVDEEVEFERRIAGVYERTIGELGDVLGGEPIGIITDD